MKPVTFPEHTVVYGEGQPKYLGLPARKFADGRLVCCWGLNWRERLRVLATGRVWHQILTFNKLLQPQLLSAEKPDMGRQPES